MSLIPASVIANLTANVDEAAMNENFTITTITIVSDGAGGSTTTTSTATTKGYLWTASGDEAGADQIKAQGRHRIAIPKTLSVPPTATITQQSTGKVFNVVYPFPVTAYSTSLIIGLEDA